VLENRKNNKFGWIAFYTMGQKYEILAKIFFYSKMIVLAFFGLNQLLFGFLIKVSHKRLNLLEKYSKCSVLFQKIQIFKVFFHSCHEFYQNSQKLYDLNRKKQKTIIFE
jgi:hypothetical protein